MKLLATNCVLLLLALAKPAGAQFEPLPPISEGVTPATYNNNNTPPFAPPVVPWEGLPQEQSGPYTPYPSDGAIPSFNPDGAIDLDAEPLPSGAKDGMLQRLSFVTGYLPKLTTDGQENVDMELFAVLGVPFPSRESPLLIAPAFETHLWQGPPGEDLPSTLYDAYLEINWLNHWNERLETYIGAAPGWHGDFQSSQEEAFRVTIQVVANYTFSPTCKLVLGAKYLDRDDVLVLPIGGFIWTPDDDNKYELVFPKPKIAHRIAMHREGEWWSYLGGELGGGIWGIEQAGVLDVMMTRDYRIFLGLEHKYYGGWISRMELGYVMGRVIEFQSGRPDIDLDNTMMVRAGMIY